MKHNFNQDWHEGQYRIDKHKQKQFKKNINEAIPEFDMFAVTCYVYEYYSGKFPIFKSKVSWDVLNEQITLAGLTDKIKRFLDEYTIYRDDLVRYPYLNRSVAIKQCIENVNL